MSSDYYNILGISKDASIEDIRSAYKKLARINHPDKGGDKDRFQKIQEAYETLSDPSKKKEYDNPNKNMGNNMFPFGFDHPFFKHHMGNDHVQQIKKSDHFYTCKISLKEVYTGTKKRLRVQRAKMCKICISKCTSCGGNGTIIQHLQVGPFTQVIQQTCGACGGKGIMSVSEKTCSDCSGKGEINEEKIFEIDIRRGIESGERFVFEEWGEQPIKDNERAGAFIVIITVDQDPIFRRHGLNLQCDIPLTFSESIVGKIVTIPHFSGDLSLDTSGFGLINPNKDYIIHDKGLVDNNGNTGQLIIRFIINYVERTFNETERSIMLTTFKKINLE